MASATSFQGHLSSPVKTRGLIGIFSISAGGRLRGDDISEEGSSDRVVCPVAVLGALTKKLPRVDDCFNGDWGFVTDLSRSVDRNGSGKPCGMQLSSPNQGWVCVTKPSMGQRKDQVVD